MFRNLRRKKQLQETSVAYEVLNNAKRIALSVNGDNGYPYCMFMNFYFDESSFAIYLHGASSGHRFDSLSNNNKVCLTTHDEGYKKPGDWAYTLNSVVVFGKASIVIDEQIRHDIAYKLGTKYYPDAEDVVREIRRDLGKMVLYKIDIEHISCKIIHEK